MKTLSFKTELPMESLRGWKNLGVVDTIYEEEDHEDFSTSPSLSPSLSLPPTPLHCRVEAWSLARGQETDVLIHIQSSRFHLHKDPLAARSGYLKRQLNESSEITTLSPPLNITAETFSLVADFCYADHLLITPFNVAALRLAAESLEMTETHCGANDENLLEKTESYFRRAVTLSREYALIVFRSSLSLLPEAETTAALVSRCIEALSLLHDGDDVMTGIDVVKTVRVEDFQIIVASTHRRLTGSHDLLYRIVDVYLKEHGGKITEEQQIRICNCIDCTMLSPNLLMHAVQNSTMPLRFIVQAMFIEQLNTRRSIFSAANNHRTRHHRGKGVTTTAAAVAPAATLGAILERDAVVRQAAQLKASMEATSSRIQCLEKELDDMRKRLIESENQIIESEPGARSASFRLSSEINKIERGQKGSVSSGSFRVFARREKIGGASSSEGSSDHGFGTPRAGKTFGRKLIGKLKSAFGTKRDSGIKVQVKAHPDGEVREGEEKHGNGDFIW